MNHPKDQSTGETDFMQFQDAPSSSKQFNQDACLDEMIPSDPFIPQIIEEIAFHNEEMSHERNRESESDVSKKKKKERKKPEKAAKEPTKICPVNCSVCGDVSTGYHYDVLSCNGCKSFFRRTLLDQRRFVCERDEKCAVLPKTRKEQKRRHCRACRFRRCVEVGMNPKGIVVEEEEEREVLHRAMKQPSLLSIAIPHKLTSMGEKINQIIDNLQYLEIKHHMLRMSDLNPLPTDPQTMEEVLLRPTAMGMLQKEMPGWPIEQEKTHARMSLEEHAQFRIPMPRLSMDSLPKAFKFWFYCDLVYAMEWAKTLNFFQRLDIVDQRLLMCHTAWQLFNVTHSYFSYSSKSERAIFPDGKYSVWTPREVDRDIITPMIRIQIDKTEYLLLKSIVICNPNARGISLEAKGNLAKERANLVKVLLNHCLKSYGRNIGPSRFGEILALEGMMLAQANKTKDLLYLLSVLNLRPMSIKLMDEICGITFFD